MWTNVHNWTLKMTFGSYSTIPDKRHNKWPFYLSKTLLYILGGTNAGGEKCKAYFAFLL